MDGQEALAEFRKIAKEFEETADEDVLTIFSFVYGLVSEKRFGKRAAGAVALLMAHQLTLEAMISTDGAAGGAVTSSGVTSEKEGDLSRSYGAVSSGGSDFDSWLKKTVYGQMFLAMRAMCVVPVSIRSPMAMRGVR